MTTHNPVSTSPVLTDHRYVCMGFLLLGLGHLIPWVSIVAAIDWWHYIYREHEHTADSIEYNLSVVYHSSLFVSMLSSTIYTAMQHRYKQSIQSANSLHSTINIIRTSFTIMLLSLLSILSFTWYTNTWLLLLLTGIIGFSEGVVRCEIYSMTAKIRTTDYTTSLMIGHTVAGILTCILRVTTKLIFHHESGSINGLYQSVVVYFVTAACILLLSIYIISKLSTNQLLRHELAIDHANTNDNNKSDTTVIDEQSPLLNDRSLPNNNHNNTSIDVSNDDTDTTYVTSQHMTVYHIYRLFWQSSVSVLINFGTTMSCYPGLITSIHTLSHYFTGGWYSIILISLYNVGDLIGRVLCLSKRFMIQSTNILTILIITRLFTMVPLFVIHIILKQSSTADEYIFSSDIISYVLVYIFGLSNGYLGTSGIIHAPVEVRAALTRDSLNINTLNKYSMASQHVNKFTDPSDSISGTQQLSFALTFVGRTMALSLCFGTVLGAYIGLILKYIIS